MRVAEYGRVSGHQQEKEATVETQIFYMDDWIEKNGHTLIDRYLDENVSYTVPIHEREDGARLLRDAAAGQFDLVVCHILDRWSRDEHIWTEGRKRLRECGVELECVTDTLDDDTPSQELGLGVKLLVAKNFARTVRFNCLNGRYRRAHEPAAYLGGVVPWGYDVIPDGPRSTDDRRRRSHLEPDTVPIAGVTLEEEPVSEASVVEWMYQRKAGDRWTHLKIAAALNRAHAPTATQNARGRHRNHTERKKTPEAEKARRLASRVWRPDTVGKMLRNPIYKGRRDYGSGRASGGTNRTGREPVRQQYPAIVSEELWQQAQDVMEVNEQNSGRNNKKHQYLLRRLLFCTHCLTVDGQYRRFAGAPSTSKTGKTLLYYVCPATQQAHQHHVEGLTPCPFGYLRADELEADMWEKLEARIRDSEGTLAKIRARAETQDDRRDALLKARDARRRQKVAKENEKREAVRLATGGVLTEAEMKERLEELRREIGELETDLQRLDRECHNLALTEAQLTEAEGWLDVWRAKIEAPLTWEEKRQVVEQFVKEILVTAGEGGGTEIVYRFCYDPNAKPLARIARPMLGRSRTGTGSCRRS